jgi:hypothetical protein
MKVDEWRDRVALMFPYLEHHEPLVAEIAYGELAAAPYAALLAAKPRLVAPGAFDVRFWPKADIPSCNAHVRFRG